MQEEVRQRPAGRKHEPLKRTQALTRPRPSRSKKPLPAAAQVLFPRLPYVADTACRRQSELLVFGGIPIR